MTKRMFRPAIAAAMLAVAISPALAAGGGGEHFEYQKQQWSFGGFWGQYDKAQLQRGFQVFQEKCSTCHALSRVNFRNLVQPGGPEFPEAAVKQLAADWPHKPLAEPNDDGNTVVKGALLERPAILADPILGPYRNDKAARAAHNGAVPPNLSIIAKARDLHFEGFWLNHIGAMAKDIASGYQEGGPDYIYNLLVNYKDEKEIPKGFKLSEGMNYNAAYPGNQIAMVPPIAKDNFVAYKDASGKDAGGSLEANAKDVAAFLTWAADPALNQRKAMGWQVMLYLLITCVLLYLGKKRVWARAGGH
jgi:ubiquinol-cytochrome c reductase cytochrome c1 subunit